MNWQQLLEFVIPLLQAVFELARDMANADGVAPDEFDAKVAELEKQRHAAFGALVAKWKGMLKP